MTTHLERIYLVANPTKPETAPALDRMTAWCAGRGIDAIPVDGAPPIRDANGGGEALVVALGGDGTVLRAAALFATTGTPILGINVGSLGFLTQAGLDEWESALSHVIEGRASIEERMRLAYEADGASGTVLNDLVVTGTTDTRFCELELSWGDGLVSAYPGDGLIVATATGSTAYSLSVGGPVIVPPAACILATPHAAHKLGLRPVIFPADERLCVRACTAIQLFADGDAVTDLPAGAEIKIHRASRPTRLVRLAGSPAFFRVLEAKLNWADPDHRRPNG